MDDWDGSIARARTEAAQREEAAYRATQGRPSDLSQSQLETLCAALGWQGGTYWQVVDEVRRLKTIADGVASDACNLTQVDRGALQMALNVLRRAGKDEVADALAAGVAIPREGLQ